MKRLKKQNLSLRLVVRGDNLTPAIRELGTLLDGLPRELAEKAADRLLGILDVPAKIVRVEGDGSAATGADEFAVRLEPSDLLLGFMAALRAGDIEHLLVETESHGDSSLAARTVA